MVVMDLRSPEGYYPTESSWRQIDRIRDDRRILENWVGGDEVLLWSGLDGGDRMAIS